MAVAEDEHDGAAHRLPANNENDTFGSWLRRARLARGWSQDQLIQRMRHAAQQLDGSQLPSDTSLKTMVSRWENSKRVPYKYNQQILAAALALPEDDCPTGTTSPESSTPRSSH